MFMPLLQGLWICYQTRRKRASHTWLRSRKQDGEIILDYPDGTNLITGVLKRGEPFPAVVRKSGVRVEGGSEMGGCWFWSWRKGATGQGMQVVLTCRESKDMDFPPPATVSRRNCSPANPFWNSILWNCKVIHLCVLSHYVCGNLLLQQ